jgi:spore germination protein YaaH
LGTLAWWASEQLPPNLRPWGEYVQQLITENPTVSIAFPFTVDAAAEAAAAESATATTTTTTGGTYTVVSGDTLGAIASHNGITLSELLALNPSITNPNYITVGQQIILPGGTQSVAETTPVAPESGQVTTATVLQELQKSLGLEFSDTATDTERWQALINMMPKIGDNLQAQQLLSSLRFNGDTNTWYIEATDQLLNPKYT